MHFTKKALWSSCLFAACCQAIQKDSRDIQKRTTTCLTQGFTLCPPNAPPTSGGSGGGIVNVPPYSLGPDPFTFINSLKRSVPSASSLRRDATTQEQFCCAPRLECRTLVNYNKYICFDNNTSDFFMNDGSNGNADAGMYYDAPAEANINIFTGDYVYANGTRGNGYDDSGLPRPTATGAQPEPTGDVVHAQASSASTTTSKATLGATATSTLATSASSAAATAKANSGIPLSMPGYGYLLFVVVLLFGSMI
ncbi:hypothetical protein BP6252_12512 [Coleophoma cylindrospora]|uniref:Uncharacterized protein n=1 Tax=Coleophoma cylindrospora TaxID=1849047 RepID=A0A3D8QC34_9HELO|nr:hypothetical protein BP6252_12512 [Coleophoma cylindrospora]